jgi:hypothetical protein
MASYGLSALVTFCIAYHPMPPLFWCLVGIINGALIGTINDIYRTKFMGV